MPEYDESEDTVTVTIAEFAEAIRKNGLPQTRANLWRFDTKFHKDIATNSVEDFVENKNNAKVAAACAFGMGLININAQYDPYEGIENSESNFKQVVYDWVWKRNDNDRWTLSQIADGLVITFKPDDKLTFKAFDWTQVARRDNIDA